MGIVCLAFVGYQVLGGMLLCYDLNNKKKKPRNFIADVHIKRLFH